MFKVNNIWKKIDKEDKLINISFRVKDGESLGIIGPHKSGKSLLMNILAGVTLPSNGNVEVEYSNIFNPSSFDTRRRIGYCTQELSYYPNSTVYEFLDYLAILKDITDDGERLLEVERILDLFDIQRLRNKLMKNLSRGAKQRVNLAQTFIGDPQILLFDEPTLGLDPMQANEMRAFLKKQAEGHIFIVASHILPEVSNLCKDLLVLDEGRVIANELSKNLSVDYCQRNILCVETAGNTKDIEGLFDGYPEVISIETILKGNNRFVIKIELDKDADIRKEVFKELNSLHMPIHSMTLEPVTLEDLYEKIDTFGEIPDSKKPVEKGKIVDFKTKRIKKGDK